MSANTSDYSIGTVGGLSNPLFVPEDLEQPLLDIIREDIFKPFIEERKFKLKTFNHANYQYVVLLPEAMIRFLMSRDNISQEEAEAVNISVYFVTSLCLIEDCSFNYKIILFSIRNVLTSNLFRLSRAQLNSKEKVKRSVFCVCCSVTLRCLSRMMMTTICFFSP